MVPGDCDPTKHIVVQRLVERVIKLENQVNALAFANLSLFILVFMLGARVFWEIL